MTFFFLLVWQGGGIDINVAPALKYVIPQSEPRRLKVCKQQKPSRAVCHRALPHNQHPFFVGAWSGYSASAGVSQIHPISIPIKILDGNGTPITSVQSACVPGPSF